MAVGEKFFLACDALYGGVFIVQLLAHDYAINSVLVGCLRMCKHVGKLSNKRKKYCDCRATGARGQRIHDFVSSGYKIASASPSTAVEARAHSLT